jgi:anti-sigma regulatory factor (Ser/Thr protein kinase)
MNRGSNLPAAGSRDHAVQFYGDDDELATIVGGYLADGIRLGEGVLVVATAPHQRAFEAALADAGIDAARERDAGRLLTEDATELLERFLAHGVVDGKRFRSLATRLVQRVSDGGRPVRVYAEMVAVLRDAGQVGLAIELEALWNGLGAQLPFALLCAYPSRLITSAETAVAAREVRRLHSTVVDPPGATGPGEADSVLGARSFPFELDSVRAARHFVTGLLRASPDARLGDDAAIVATELAANAVLHAHSGFTVTVARSPNAVKVAVRDGDPLTFQDDRGPACGDDVPFDVRPGHGLSIVAQLASAWSVERLPDGKVIWADLPAATVRTAPQATR